MAKVLVTGGAGFIGSHIAEELVEMDYTVVILDDLSGGFRENIPEGVEFVEGSILDEDLLATLFKHHKFSYVFHLAAYAAEGLSHFIKRFNYSNNLIGSVNLINLSVLHRVQCFVFTSSIAVYGRNQVPMSEKVNPRPEDSYGIAKLAVEDELRISHEMFGLPYIIFRPHNVYGERQNIGDKYRNVVGIFMNQIMQGLPMTIFGEGKQTRAFSNIADVVPAMAKSIRVPEAYNEIFNIGSDKPYSLNQLAAAIANAFEVELNVQYLDPRNEVLEAYSDHSKAERILKVSSGISLEKGLRRFAAWAKEQGPRVSKDFTDIDIEIPINLPPSWR